MSALLKAAWQFIREWDSGAAFDDLEPFADRLRDAVSDEMSRASPPEEPEAT